MKRLLIATLAALFAASVVGALATTLGGVTGSLGTGSSPVLSCDADGLSIAYTTSGANVTAVVVSGIADPTCEGGALQITLVNGTNAVASGGPQVVPTDGGTTDNSVAVAMSPQPAASAVTGLHVVIEGP